MRFGRSVLPRLFYGQYHSITVRQDLTLLCRSSLGTSTLRGQDGMKNGDWAGPRSASVSLENAPMNRMAGVTWKGVQRWRWASLSLLLCSLRGTELALHTRRRRGFHSDTDTVVWYGMYVQGILFWRNFGKERRKTCGLSVCGRWGTNGKTPLDRAEIFPLA